jgi:hypothetical protein
MNEQVFPAAEPQLTVIEHRKRRHIAGLRAALRYFVKTR